MKPQRNEAKWPGGYLHSSLYDICRLAVDEAQQAYRPRLPGTNPERFAKRMLKTSAISVKTALFRRKSPIVVFFFSLSKSFVNKPLRHHVRTWLLNGAVRLVNDFPNSTLFSRTSRALSSLLQRRAYSSKHQWQ